MAQVKTAIFPVGGLGTRFLPATKAMPKEMLTVVDKPLIQYAVEEAEKAGIEKFIFVTGKGKQSIEDHFDYNQELYELLKSKGKVDLIDCISAGFPSEGKICYTRQHKPLGLGHAIWCAKEYIGSEPFAILSADDLILSKTPCLKQMIGAYNKNKGNIVALMEVEDKDVSKYGIIEKSSNEQIGPIISISKMIEKPTIDKAPSNLAIVGRYILSPEIFSYLEKFEKGAGNEIQLTDAMEKLLQHQSFHGVMFEGTRFDCGDKLGYLEANVAFALERDDLSKRFYNKLQNYINNDRDIKCA